MGDDSRNEYIYKYVSNKPWDPRDAHGGLAAGDKYLDDGQAVRREVPCRRHRAMARASRSASNGVTPNNAAYAFADQADVLINVRLAADAAGATKMDRPEWGAVIRRTARCISRSPTTTAAQRPLAAVDAANPRFYNDKRPRARIRRAIRTDTSFALRKMAGTPDALSFTWDVFLFGARASADPTNVNLSGLTDANDFSSPDGLWFSYATPACCGSRRTTALTRT